KFYPVLRGLTVGEKIVTVGSYLLDAETKVSGAAGSIYYGGTGSDSKEGGTSAAAVRPSTPADEEDRVKAALAKLSAVDRKSVDAQKLCPIRKTRLGSMGTPVKVILEGKPVFLCCKGCEEEAREHPGQTLAAV